MTSTVMAIKRKTRKKAEPTADAAGSSLKVTEPTIKKLTNVFKLLADKNRLKIVVALGQHGKMHVSDLCKMLKQSQPAVSHHLTLMRTVGLISFDREGKHNFYYLNTEYVGDLFEQLFSDVGAVQALEFEDFALTISRQGD